MKNIDFENFEDSYDHDLISLLNLLKKVNLQQFILDLKINDRETFNKLVDLLNKESGSYAYRS